MSREACIKVHGWLQPTYTMFSKNAEVDEQITPGSLVSRDPRFREDWWIKTTCQHHRVGRRVEELGRR